MSEDKKRHPVSVFIGSIVGRVIGIVIASTLFTYVGMTVLNYFNWTPL
jgi:hypothetical protein